MKYDIDLFYSGLKQVISATRGAIDARIGKGFAADIKKDGTFVTDVDRDAENAARSTILRLFPEHSIVGEEYPALDNRSEYTWYIDPIDGTQNLKHGVPTFGTVLALYHNDTPLVAAIDHPALNLCYLAAKGRGATKNNQAISIDGSGNAELDRQDIIGFPPRYNLFAGKSIRFISRLPSFISISGFTTIASRIRWRRKAALPLRLMLI
jgi:fructose-1,6-bisphosphatase/inositol monophosphatase family enzyme